MELRLADLLASLSLFSDLGMGYPQEQALESCLIACGLGREMNLSQEEQRDVYYTALLSHIGCTAGAHEQAMLAGGDDIALRGIGSRVAFGSPREVVTELIPRIGRDLGMLQRTRVVAVMLTRGERVAAETNRATCEVAAQMARRIGLPASVQGALSEMFERWDGKGLPRKLAGEDISPAMRLAVVASQAALFNRLGGVELAREMIGGRSGDAYDPEIAALFVRCCDRLLAEIDAADTWTAVLDAEPRPHRMVSPGELDQIARAFADAVDLKSPYMHQHSVEVARLAEGAAHQLGLGESTATTVRLAGLFHDIGRVAVPNGIWEKPAALSVSEWEQVRLHPYHSERILARSPALVEIASFAGMHHERCDGGGYYRGLQATSFHTPGRLLAAADTYQAMTQERPYRPALSAEAAAEQLSSEVAVGWLDREVVDAVLVAAGQRSAAGPIERPAGLTEREIEVLRLAARGFSNREMGRQLSISPKTVGHHIQHIYDKIGVSTRAAAALYAMEHDLLH